MIKQRIVDWFILANCVFLVFASIMRGIGQPLDTGYYTMMLLLSNLGLLSNMIANNKSKTKKYKDSVDINNV
jgi:hypothetical protein